MSVVIVEEDSQGSSRRMPFVNAADDSRYVRLVSLCTCLPFWGSAGDVVGKIFQTDRDALGDTVQSYTYCFTVGFSENGDFENS